MKRVEKRKHRPRVGDVVGIPLPNGSVAYARVFKDGTFGIYAMLSKAPPAMPQDLADARFAFHIACDSQKVESGEWPILGHLAFRTAGDAWPPPQYIQDVIDPTQFRILHRDKMRTATAEEVEGLEEAAAFSPSQLIERIEKNLPRLLRARAPKKGSRRSR